MLGLFNEVVKDGGREAESCEWLLCDPFCHPPQTHSWWPGAACQKADPVNTQEEPCCCLVTELGLGNFGLGLLFRRTEILIPTPTAIVETNGSREAKPL